MAATCSSAHQHDLHHHSAVFRGVSHDDLRATVQGEEHDLLHPLEYYSPKFIGWALKHGVWFDSVSEGVHALKVSFLYQLRSTLFGTKSEVES